MRQRRQPRQQRRQRSRPGGEHRRENFAEELHTLRALAYHRRLSGGTKRSRGEENVAVPLEYTRHLQYVTCQIDFLVQATVLLVEVYCFLVFVFFC
jgi:hypothetical protein